MEPQKKRRFNEMCDEHNDILINTLIEFESSIVNENNFRTGVCSTSTQISSFNEIMNVEDEPTLTDALDRSMMEERNIQQKNYVHQNIKKLEGNGIISEDIKNLSDAGYHTVESIGFVPKKNLISIEGITKVKANKIKDKASKIASMEHFTISSELKPIDIIKLTTGSSELDKLLDGGIELGSITEVFGEAGAGKTQLCFTLAVTSQLPLSQNGGQGKCLYIDTENSFRHTRISDIAKRYNLDSKVVFDNIMMTKVHNTDFLEMISNVGKLMATSKYAIIIVDSASGLYRTEYSGLSELPARQAYLGRCLRKLHNLACEFKVAVLITNQVVANIDGASMLNRNPHKPIGGNIFRHASTTRLHFKKRRGITRICKMYDSPCLPQSEILFAIKKGGIEDADDD